MDVGERFELTINDIAFGGDGVGHAPDGRAVFVPFTAEDDVVEVEVTDVQRRFARAELKSVMTPATCRVEPHCPYFGRCGGCQYQHLDPTAEQMVKQRQLTELLARIGQLKALPDVETICTPQDVYGYRNKLVLSPIQTEGEPHSPVQDYGFREVDGHTLFPVAECPIAHNDLNALLPTARQEALEAQNAVQFKKPGRLVLRKPGRGNAEAFLTSFPRPRENVQEQVLGKPVDVPPLSFYQVNPAVADAIIATVAQLYDNAPTPLVIDAYAGVGIFSLALGNAPERTLIIERDRRAVGAARHNHNMWELNGRDYLTAPAEDVLGNALTELGDAAAATTVILDPPRSGCAKAVLKALRNAPVGRIIYVSCDASTLARDVQALCQSGPYLIDDVRWADMFPQTAHFESVVVLQANASPGN